MRGYRGPAATPTVRRRVGSMADGRPEPLPKNRLDSRVETLQRSLKVMEQDRDKLIKIIRRLVKAIDEDDGLQDALEAARNVI